MISIVIPSFNRRECMLALLTGISRQTGTEFEVIVVDDGSGDGSPDAIRQRFPDVKVLVNEHNGGPSVSRNRGIKAASGEIIVGLDSDVTVPDPAFLEKVRHAFERNPDAAGLAFRILQPDGVSDDKPRWWHPLPIDDYAAREFETSYFSGTGYAFRRQPVIDAGLFPEILYMHYEEVELAWRILDGGGKILYQPDLAVLHHVAPTTRRSRIETFFKPRNQILLALGTLPFPRNISYLAPRFLFQFFKALTKGHLPSWFSAVLSAAKLLPAVKQSRKPIQAATVRYSCRLEIPPNARTAASKQIAGA